MDSKVRLFPLNLNLKVPVSKDHKWPPLTYVNFARCAPF